MKNLVQAYLKEIMQDYLYGDVETEKMTCYHLMRSFSTDKWFDLLNYCVDELEMNTSDFYNDCRKVLREGRNND